MQRIINICIPFLASSNLPSSLLAIPLLQRALELSGCNFNPIVQSNSASSHLNSHPKISLNYFDYNESIADIIKMNPPTSATSNKPSPD